MAVVPTSIITVAADLSALSSNATVTVGNVGGVQTVGTAIITGPMGATGTTGLTGATGAIGNGVTTGGTLGQVLTKNTSTNFDVSWQPIPTATFSNSGSIQLGTDLGGSASAIQVKSAHLLSSGFFILDSNNVQWNVTIATDGSLNTSPANTTGNLALGQLLVLGYI